jgi:endonuclease YncB( thermonuclease family)
MEEIMEIFVIIWLVCAFLCAAVAHSKARWGFGWFLGGFLLGPLGLIAIAGMPVLTEERRPPKVDWVALAITLAIVFGVVWLVTTIANAADTLVGEVTHVRDGDTIEVDGTAIRLNGVAAPERTELGYHTAKTAMEALVKGRIVECDLNGERSYDRLIGVCFIDGADLGAVMIKMGVARDCPAYSGGRYRNLEESAAVSGSPITIIYPLPSYCR